MPDSPYTVVFLGNWGLGLSALNALLKAPVRLIRVLTRFDPLSGDPFLNLVQQRAVARGLPVVNTDKSVCPKAQLEQHLLACAPVDFLVVCCFDRILTDAMLGIARVAAVNVHTSLLPKFRGPKPLDNAIVHGERFTGVTLHELASEVDAGDIILQDASLEIRPADTYGALFDRQSAMAAQILSRFFEDPSGHLARKQAQSHELASTAPRLPWVVGQDETAGEMRSHYRRTL
jgi:methionyl-tRNA formyltransferase